MLESFFHTVRTDLLHTFPLILRVQLYLVPFILLEQWMPAGPRPRLRDYLLNIAISLSTVALALPLGMLVASGAAVLRERLGLHPIALSLQGLERLPFWGPGLEAVAVIVAAFFLHDLWFYWAHRIEHAVPFLWQFHKLHHGDERMNSATSSRDHFLQQTWVRIFPTFTVGFLISPGVKEAARHGVLVGAAMILVSMFYHSGVKLRLSWLDRIIVTPQVHRIHHSVDPGHYNKNFADFLPIFDIVFGTFHKPAPGEYPATGLAEGYRAPRGLLAAQFGPVVDAAKLVTRKRTKSAVEPASSPDLR